MYISDKVLRLLGVLTLIVFFHSGLLAQEVGFSPGGTELTIEVWLAADKVNGSGNVLPADGTLVTKWTSVHTGGRDYVNSTLSTATYNNIVPTFKSTGTLFNYQPALNFNQNPAKLVNQQLFDLSSNSFYVFYVSQVTNTSGANVLFTLSTNDGTSRNNNIGWYNGNPYFSLDGTATSTRRVHQGNGMQYGINAAIITNSTTVVPRSYMNGIINTTAFAARKLNVSTATASVIGTSNAAATLPFSGDVQELIILSAPAGTYINDADLIRINTYLAIKYGITLNNGLSDYKASDNVVIWSADPDYNNTIFGIGRDDATGLYQKQSVSTDESGIAISLGDFAVLNADNAGTIENDKTFLMLGSKGRFDGGATSYAYTAGTAFKNKQSEADINYKLGYTLKAQTTNQENFTVNLKMINQNLINEAKYVLVSDNTDFIPGNTRIYTIDSDNTAHDVIINNGDYIAFAAAGGKGPGGVFQGMKVWVKADDFTSLQFDESGNVIGWLDQTFNNNDFSYDALTTSGKVKPTYMSCDENSNFNPAVYFQVAQAALAMPTGPLDVDTPDETTSFLIYHSTIPGNSDRYYTHGFGGTNHMTSVTRHPAVGFAPDDRTGRVRTEGYTYDGTTKGYHNMSTALHEVYLGSSNSTSGKKIIHDFGGWKDIVSDKTTVNDLFYEQFQMSKGMTLGGASYVATSQFVGTIPEFFFYDRHLNNDEENRIRAYLGMKYAITLNADQNNTDLNYDYELSDGTIVWAGNSAPNKYYHNNVAGLFRDDMTTGFNNKAKSTADGGMITMILEGHTECGQGEISALPNNFSGLFWGNDNGAETITTVEGDCFDFTERNSRIWLVQRTNLDKVSVVIRAGLGSSDFDKYISEGYQAFLLVADNAEDFANKNWKLTIPGNFIDGEHQFKYTFRQEQTYFSLGFKGSNSPCPTCSFAGDDSFYINRSNLGAGSAILKAIAPTKTISASTINNNLGVDIEFKMEAGTSRMQIRPGAKNSTNIYMRGVANAKSQITCTLSEAADVSFAIGGIDKNEIVEVYGYCQGNVVRPIFVYLELLTGSNKKRGYTFDIVNGNKAAGNGKTASGRANPRGMMHVQFGSSVEQIVIEYTNTRAGTAYLDLFPIKFSCPQPLPAPNEAGYSLQKRAALESHICEMVEYTFTMVNANAGCDSSRVSLVDILPEGMYWVPNSLILDQSLLNASIEDNGDETITMSGNVLRIDSLKLPGDGRTTLVKAKAAFEENAIINTTYYNQSSISYTRKDNGETETLTSTDAFYIDGSDKRTPTFVADEERDYIPVNTGMSLTPSTSFKHKDEIEVTLTIDNPNDKIIGDMLLEISYNENFYLKPGSIQINGNIPDNSISIQIEKDEEGEEMPGYTLIEGFSLPANSTGPSATVITYIIIAPEISDLEYEMEDGKKIYYPACICYDLTSFMDGGECINSVFHNAVDTRELLFRAGRSHVMTNKHATKKIQK